MLTHRRNLYQSNGTTNMLRMTLLRGTLLSLALAAFAFTAGPVQAKCDPATDPDCTASQTKKAVKKEQPKTPAAEAPKPKKSTASSEAPSNQGGEAKKQTGTAPKAKKSASAEDRTEQITEENRVPAPKKTTGQPARVNPVEFDKATGKHCSGQDDFRVCW
jgi:hypothetical protein